MLSDLILVDWWEKKNISLLKRISFEIKKKKEYLEIMDIEIAKTRALSLPKLYPFFLIGEEVIKLP